MNVPSELRRRVETAIFDALDELAIPRGRLRRRSIGVEPSDRAEACGYEVGCLSKLGRLLGAELMVVGTLRPRDHGRASLELVGLDTGRERVTDVADWTFEPEAAEVAASTLARRIVFPPSAELVFDVEPRNARIDLYGERMTWRATEAVPVVPGTYRLELSASGRERRQLLVEVRPGERVIVKAELEVDPLYVPDVAAVEVFRGERNGRGLDADRLRLQTPADESRRPVWPRVLYWSAVAATVGVSVAGGVVVADAQARYDRLSSEVRFTPGTTSAREAVDARAEALDQQTIGNVMLWTGLGLAAVGTLVGLAVPGL